MSFALTMSWMRSVIGSFFKRVTARLIFRLEDDLGSFCRLGGIVVLTIGRVMEPSTKDAGCVSHANLYMGSS